MVVVVVVGPNPLNPGWTGGAEGGGGWSMLRGTGVGLAACVCVVTEGGCLCVMTECVYGGKGVGVW